jgi:branched-chain amino acid transport system ATP-binding protein
MTDSLVISAMRVVRGMKEVVHGVDMEIKPGQVTTLLGANGAGKSSIVLSIAGTVRPSAGSVRVGTQELAGKAPHVVRAMGVAAVPEGHRVLTELTVHENLQAAGSMHAKGEVDVAVQEALDVFPELSERLGQRAGTLSGGQQQMVSLAQALVCRPKFLLADELSLGLAPLVVKRLVVALRRVAASGTGVLLIEQFTTIALDLATDAYLIERGNIRWSGPAQTLKDQPDLLHAAYLAGSSA